MGLGRFVIRKILEEGLIIKIVLLSISPIIFFLTNIIGFLIDSVNKDDRFASCYHVVMRKI